MCSINIHRMRHLCRERQVSGLCSQQNKMMNVDRVSSCMYAALVGAGSVFGLLVIPVL